MKILRYYKITMKLASVYESEFIYYFVLVYVLIVWFVLSFIFLCSVRLTRHSAKLNVILPAVMRERNNKTSSQHNIHFVGLPFLLLCCFALRLEFLKSFCYKMLFIFISLIYKHISLFLI